jgi:hypothetical protein
MFRLGEHKTTEIDSTLLTAIVFAFSAALELLASSALHRSVSIETLASVTSVSYLVPHKFGYLCS